MDDNLIIEKILDGDKDLYQELMDKYYKELFKFVYNMVNSYETTEDLLQEVFLKCYRNLSKYDSSKASFRTWIYRVCSNHTLNFLKKKSNRLNRFTYEYDDTLSSSFDDVEAEAIKDEQINQILIAMEKVLKPKHYKIVSLYYFSNLTPNEISEITGIPVKTIYKAIQSSVEKIKKEVGNNVQ